MPRDTTLMKDILSVIESELIETPTIFSETLYSSHFSGISKLNYSIQMGLLYESKYIEAIPKKFYDSSEKMYYITRVTNDGYNFMEGKDSNNSVQNVFNIKEIHNSNLATQGDATITVNNYYSYEDFKSKIAENGGEDKETLNELNDTLNELIELNKPIEKGIFAKFGDVVSKHSWVLTIISDIIMAFAFKS